MDSEAAPQGEAQDGPSNGATLAAYTSAYGKCERARAREQTAAVARFTCVLLAAAVALASAHPAAAQDDDAKVRSMRWESLKESIFGKRPLADGGPVVELDAPARALDAALVPVTITLKGRERVKGLYLVIDMNPAPLASHFSFGPEADPHVVKLRVRVDQYTSMHAIAETDAGKLYVAEKFVKAAGGCSAPAGASDEEALRELGLMKLRLLSSVTPGAPVQAQLMIRHPNFNGMQMNQLTQIYTPARYIRTIDVSYRGGRVFHLDSDISLSSDPVITFGFVPRAHGDLTVVARDSKDAVFEHAFEIP